MSWLSVVGGTDVRKATKAIRGAFSVSGSYLRIFFISRFAYPTLSSQITQHRCASAMVTTKSNLTVGLVAKMTTFELRQEVEKRGLLGELQNINHDTLLRRLVQVPKDIYRHRASDSTAAVHCGRSEMFAACHELGGRILS